MKKRLPAFLLLLSMALTFLPVSASALELILILPPLTLPDTTWDGTRDQSWSGSGSPADPYLITTAEELAGLAAQVNAGTHYKGTYFRLTADVRLNRDSLREWLPIGDKNHLFRGVFDGGGHTVSGLYIDRPNDDWLGLFGGIGAGGTVVNLGILAGLIHGDGGVGSVAGFNSGLIQNCYSTGDIYAKGDYVGGIAGRNQGAVVDCYNTGNITGIGSSDNHIGGITGYNAGGAVIGSYNAGEVTGRFRIGGIAGRNGDSGILFNCWNTGDITSTMHETGGIVGHNGPQCIVANCYNTGDIRGTHRVGGITGYNYAGVTINAYNTGYVTGRSGEYGIGAVVGYNDDRAVSGTGFLGGYDVPDKTGYVVSCYWLAGCIDAGRRSGVGSNDANCSIIGVGKFTSSSSNIIATDTGRGGSSVLSELIEGAVSLGLEVGIDLLCQELEVDVPACLKDINIEIDSQAAFPGNATTYSGTLLEVLCQGSGAETSGNYGMWYQYADTNGGYPVLIEKTSLIFTPVFPGLRPIDAAIITPIVEEIEEESEAEEETDAAAFTLSDRYPADQEIDAGGTAGFSTSLAAGSAAPANLNREWHVVCGGSDYFLSGDTEINGCSFLFVNDNYLRATAAEDAASAVYRIYCIVSNESGSLTSRTATLTVNGAETPYEFPFTDVASGAWYRNDVETAHKNGLINGKTATLYSPDDNMTVAEAVKLAACMHQLYHTGSVTLTNGSPYWYSSYVTYALDNGIIDGEYADWTEKITRRAYVHIFYSALPASEYAPRNTVADGAIPDVSMADPHASEIYAFYSAGILTGSDSAGTFHPLSNIRRSEVAAILTRMFDASARKSITLT